MNIPKIDLPRIVIIGCGFAGLKFLKGKRIFSLEWQKHKVLTQTTK